MKYKCAIFDLDGTLLDSLQGILNACNKTFKELGYNVVKTYDDCKHFVGSGALVFVERALKGLDLSLDEKNKFIEQYFVNYAITQKTDAKPFEGIISALEELQNRGMILCIASNKPQIMLDPIVDQLFPTINFKYKLGVRPKIPTKPDPFCIFEILNGLNLKADDVVYVGDSEYDYKTAHNAGVDAIICKYGYGFYDEQWIHKVRYKVETVEELKEKLLSD